VRQSTSVSLRLVSALSLSVLVLCLTPFPGNATTQIRMTAPSASAKSSACSEFSFVVKNEGGFPTSTEVSKLLKAFTVLMVQSNQYVRYYDAVQVLWTNATPLERSDALVLLTSFCDRNVTLNNLFSLTKKACFKFSSNLDARISVQDSQYWTHDGLGLTSAFANLYVLNTNYERIYSAAHLLANPLTGSGDDMIRSIAILKAFCRVK